MKKLLLLLASSTLSVAPAIGLSNVVSCGNNNDSSSDDSTTPSDEKVDISLESTSEDLTNGDDSAIKILNFSDLENVTISVNDESICSASLVGDSIKIKAIKDGTGEITVNADNSNAPVKITINDSSILQQNIGTVKGIVDTIGTLLDGVKSDSDIVNAISGVAPMLGSFKTLIQPILEKLSSVDAQYFDLIGKAIDPSVYGDMTNEQVLQAAQIRIVNGVLSMTSKQGSSDEGVVEWSNKENLSSNIIKSMGNFSDYIKSLVDGTSNINKDSDDSSINTVYSISEIIGGIVPILDYISRFDITGDLLTFNDIQKIQGEKYNNGTDVEMNISQLSKNITKAFDSKISTRNLMGILFAVSNDKSGELTMTDGDNNPDLYTTNGISPIIEAALNGVLTSDKITESIDNDFIKTILSSLLPIFATAVPNLFTYLFNCNDGEWNADEIELGSTKLSSYCDYLSLFNLDDTTKATIEAVLDDPISAIQPMLAGIIPGLESNSVESIFTQIAPELDLNRYIGKLADSSIGDILDLTETSMGDNSQISLTGLGQTIDSFASTVDDNGTSTAIINYIANQDDFDKIDGKFWGALGVDSTSTDKPLKDGSVLKGISTLIINDWPTTHSFLDNFLDGLDNIYKS